MSSRAFLAVCLLAMAMSVPLANAQCTAGQPRLVLTGVAGGCESDPVTQCLSDVSLELTAACAVSATLDGIPDSAATIRIQKRFDADGNIKRNAMDAVFPWISDDAYTTCAARVDNMTAVGSGTANAALSDFFNYIDSGVASANDWAVTGTGSSVKATKGACELTYSILYSALSGTQPAVASGDDEDTVSVGNGAFAALVTNTGAKQYISALCPSGTYSNRGGSSSTIKTGCDKSPAGTATNMVGATTARVNSCPAGTFASEGAAMCLPCDKDTFAPFDEMPVCAECRDGFAPVQGSPRCFAGFGGRVIVTEGQGVGTNKNIYDPNGSVMKIYGDDSSAVTADAKFPAGGWTYVTRENDEDSVPKLGGPLEGWSVIDFAATASTNTISLAFLETCTSATTSGAVLVSEDGVATISMLGSYACGQINGRTEDINGTVPADFTDPNSNFQNLTMTYASPVELIAHGVDATTGRTATIYVSASGASVSFTLLQDSTSATASVAGKYVRTVTVKSNNFAATVPAAAPLCIAGTSYVEKADSSGFAYSRQCRPCPDGYYCPAGRAGFSPVATPCAAGSRGTVFGQTAQSFCVSCKAGYYQDTAGSITCDTCGTALAGATTCPTSCPDGTEGDPRLTNGCTACAAGSYRSGDMPACIPCAAGSEVWADDGTGDKQIDSRSALGGQDCRPCEPGYFNDRSTVGQCTQCGAGSYSPRGGLASCLACPAGTWQNATGTTACKKAAKGTFITGSGATNNTQQCKVGFFGEVAGGVSEATACKKCKPGTFQNSTGATSCDICKVGFYQDKSAQTSCTQCPAGTINTAPGASTCAICAPGSFSAKGASTCTKCPVGTFQDKAKQSGCKPCPAGSFCPQAGMTKATACPIGTYNPRPNGSSQRLACLPCAKATKTGTTKC